MKFLILILLCLSIEAQAEEKKKLDLNDLGLKLDDIEIDKGLAGDLVVRKDKLEKHEILGLTTLGFMAATLLTAETVYDSDTHMILGMTTATLYYTTAYYSLSAPKPESIKDRGSVKWHKRLAWIHFPAMVLAPILGYIKKRNSEKGKENKGLVNSHGAIAGLGAGAFALSAALMTFDIDF